MLTQLLLDEFAELLATTDAPVGRALRPGLSEDEVRSRLHAAGLGEADEAVVWWTSQ